MSRTDTTRCFQIFRSGKHTSIDGTTLNFSPLDVKTSAGVYSPIRSSAPLVLGHPPSNGPAYGEVTKLFEKDNKLFCLANVSSALINAVKAGLYKKVSAAFHHPRHPSNPVPGSWYLRHVGFLGAMPPAIKQMAALNFAEWPGVLSFSGPGENPAQTFTQSIDRRNEADQLTLFAEARIVRELLPDISFTEALSLVSQ